MIRPIFNCVGHIFQLIRNNIKALILLASFGTFIWLIVNTTNRAEFNRHSSKLEASTDEGNDESDLKNRWSESSVEIFLSLLEIEGNVTKQAERSQNDPCPLKNELVFTAFIDDSLEENLWQYYTLIALRQNAEFNVKPFLPQSTKQALERLFENVPMEVIGELSFDCYDIGSTIILNTASDIPRPQRRDQLYVLDSGTRRYLELTTTDWSMEDKMLKPADAGKAQTRLAKLLSQGPTIRPENRVGVEFVGIYIRQDDLFPFEYYYRAIAFQRKLHAARLIFVVICEEPQGKLCKKIHAPKEEVYVQPSKDAGQDFALMSLCNHTIISNQVGIFHALNNGGEVVVYEFDEPTARVQYVPWLIANEMDNWYMLG